MRRHARFQALAPKYDVELFHEIVRSEHLCAARLDPGINVRMDGEGLLDLTFAKGGCVVVVPLVIVQSVMLVLRDKTPFIWPAWLPPARRETLRQIEERLDPWLSSLTQGRFLDHEVLEFFGSDSAAHDFVRRARAAGFLGAAPYETALRMAAPYVYAMRFGRGRRVLARDANGASGAAMLARVAGSIEMDLGDRLVEADATRWFGLDAYAPLTPGPCDLWVGSRNEAPSSDVRILLDASPAADERTVRIALSIPPSLLVSFDTSDSDAVGSFAVAALEPPVRAAALAPSRVVGGSAGRIALVVRADAAGFDDADIDEARSLESSLNEQGFSARVVSAAHLRPEDYDLVHVFGRRCSVNAAAAIETCTRRPPVVVTPYLDDPQREAAWGAALAKSTLANAYEESLRGTYFAALAGRSLVAQGLPERGSPSPDEAALRRLLGVAGAAIVSGPEEEGRLREEFGFSGCVRHVPAMLGVDPPLEPIAGIVGADDFVLLHAPMDARCNQYAVAVAASELEYPTLFVGTVGDFAYYADVLAKLGPLGMWLSCEEASPGELASLYRRARVFVDVGWSSNGLARLARAGAGGTALVVASAGQARAVWPGLAQIADPASTESIAAGLRAAWERAGELGPATAARTAQICDPFSSLVTVLAAYQAAAGP